MAATIDPGPYSDALVVLGTAGVIVPLVRRLGLNPILGYLAAGAALGPFGLGSVTDALHILDWVTIRDAANVAGIAQLGIVFLLFIIGLELSFERLKTMRRLVFGLGLAQVAVTAAVIGVALMALGVSPTAAGIAGVCLSLSSTAIVLDLFSAQRRMASSAGRGAFAVLLAQDLAVIPLLLFIPALGGVGSGGSVLMDLAWSLAMAAVALGIIVVAGRLLLRPLFRQAAGAGEGDSFVAASLFVIVGAGVAAALAGLSMALGAFVAGLLLAETEYRKAIEAYIGPFKGILLGVFFFTVGMAIDMRELLRQPGLFIAAIAGLIAVKAAVLFVLARLFRLSAPAAAEMSLPLAAGGEFAFVGIGLASGLALVPPALASFVLAVTSVTMAAIPVLSDIGRRAALALAPAEPQAAPAEPPPQLTGHAIVVGHGRVGKVVCALLARHKRPYLAVESSARDVARDRADGHQVYFGSALDPGFLKACGLMEASGLIITVQKLAIIDEILEEARAMRPDIPIFTRAHDATHASHLYAMGATDVVPETIEASLQLSEAALVGLGVPTGPVIASIHEQRDVYRRELRKAAKAAGASPSLGIRAKTKKA